MLFMLYLRLCAILAKKIYQKMFFLKKQKTTTTKHTYELEYITKIRLADLWPSLQLQVIWLDARAHPT